MTLAAAKDCSRGPQVLRSAHRADHRGTRRRVLACAAKMQVSILMVRALAGAIERAGKSRARFFEIACLDERAITDGSTWLSMRDYVRVLEAALEVSGDAAFGFYMGEQARSGMFDIMGPLTEHAATLRDSIDGMARYARLFAEGHDPELREREDEAAIQLPSLRGDFPLVRVTAEFSMTALLGTLELFAGPKARPTAVRFAYPAPAYVARYERVFGGAARFDCEVTEMVFPRTWLDRTQPYRSPELYAVLREQADRSLGRIERGAPLRSRIDDVLTKHAPRSLTMEEVARELGMSDRSLRRRLLAESLSFSDLLARSRMNTAKRMLERPSASIKETAFAMGFASETAFHRAFKRWTGMTPKQYQESF